MKKLRLLKLVLKNFKGIRNFVLDASGENVSVYGDNAAGKTTLFDAFVWLLFDKDSANRKDFQIKTVDQNGNEIHGLDHEVEGVFEIDGKKTTLRKVYSEKWTKKRGSAISEFTGHTTDYFIDGVPVKKNEYTAQIDEIVSEDIFKLLTSPTYFNEQLHWEERRKILLQICGDLTDEEVITSNPVLSKLMDILQGRKLEDHRKVIAARRSEINKELEKIPVRIDEAERSKPDLAGLNEADLQKQIDDVSAQIEMKQEELQRVQSGGEIAVKEKRIREIESEMLEIKNKLQAGTHEAIENKRNEVFHIGGDYSQLKKQISDLYWKVDRNHQQLGDLKLEADSLRKKWHEENDKTFDFEHDDSCPACGQALPDEQIKEAHDKAMAEFNRRKAERLEEITSKGKATSAEIKRLEEENEALQSEIEQLEQQLSAKEAELKTAENELNGLQNSVVDVESDAEYAVKKQEMEAIKAEILNLRQSTLGAVDSLRMEIAKLRNEKEGLEQKKARFAQGKAIDVRISELKQQERDLAAEFERLEEELHLTEEFVRTKVNLLEEKINSRFKFARFKLFEQQINGGLREVCETLYDGVPYSGGLNNAARINVGLDIINTLSEHYGFSVPIFIDNAESVTKLIDTHGQQVKLIVSAGYKSLRVEHENDVVKEAV